MLRMGAFACLFCKALRRILGKGNKIKEAVVVGRPGDIAWRAFMKRTWLGR